MTYQGERARSMGTESGRLFEVSKVRMGLGGHVSDVLWREVNSASNLAVGNRVVATVAEVVDAIHDGAQVAAVFTTGNLLPRRKFLVVEQSDGSEHIAIEGKPSPGRNASDLEKLGDHDELAPGGPIGEYRNKQPKNSRMQTFAVSKVQLDPAGRITDVLWGRVDTNKNTWATPQRVALVAAVVDVLRNGDQVFALFPSVHGHLPERRFMVADYDGGRNTIVLDGPTASEREVHDMDRLNKDEPY
jgi:hypothetical protein